MIFRRSLLVIVCGLVVLLAAQPAVSNQPKLPDTFAGEQFAEFAQAFNSGNEEHWRSWILEDPRAADSAEVFERRFGFFKMFYKDLGGFEIAKIGDASEYSITALIKAISPQGPFEWVNMTLSYDTAAPHRLLFIDVRPGEGPDDKLPEGDITDAALAEYLNNYITELTGKERFSGAVLIAKDGEPIYTYVVGLASKRFNISNKLDTKFNLGSMNKMFTGVAVAQLAQAGKLSFDDPVGMYLPDYPNAEVAEKVTIHHLLTHTSGIGDYWDELFNAHWWEIKTVGQLVELAAHKPLEFQPGERFGYSNAGPVVLGLIIEKITGQSYYDYVRQNIYEPAGMTSTDCYEMDRPVPNLAIGYTRMNYDGSRSEDGWHNNLFMHAAKGGPAGGGFSTVEDLLKFDNALRQHKLLNEEYTNIVTTGKVEMGPDMKYAYLFGDEIADGHRIVGHNGGAPGISAVLDMYWDSGYTVAVLSNYDNAAGMVARKIGQLLKIKMQQES